MQQYDVVVIGAGLAGLQCARLMALQGVRVLLVDRKTTLTRSHTTGIFVRRTLESFELPDTCLGPVVRQVKLYSPGRRVCTLESSYDEFRIGRMGQLYMHYLRECRQAGVVWMPACRYKGCEVSDSGSKVYLGKGNRDWWVRTRYIVGADGVYSRVARDLQLDINTEWIVGVEDVLRGVPLQDAPCFHCFLDAELSPGYLAWLVHDGEEVHLGVGGYATRFQPLKALLAFRASLREIVDLRSAERIERRGGRIPVGGILPHIVNRSGLLVGDAAGAPSPLTAGGLDPCMRMSALAAQVIVGYLSTGSVSVLARYDGKQMRPHFRSRQMLRRIIATVPSQGLLEGICALLRLPPFRSVAEQIFFGPHSFPDLKVSSPSHGG